MTRGPVVRRGAVALQDRRIGAGAVLAALLAIGFLLRVFIAGILLPQSGLANDIGAFAGWAQRLASVGPPGFYEIGYFSDYPPGYLYILWLLGGIGALVAPIVGVNITPGLVKVPAILADIGLAWLLFIMVRRWAPQLRKPDGRWAMGLPAAWAGVLIAAIYLFNPATVFNASVWGQVDSVGALVLLGTIYTLGRGWTEVAAAGAVLAMLIKFQFAFLIPVVAIIGIKRHLLGRSADPAHDGRRDSARVLWAIGAGVATLILFITPFRMTLYWPLPGGDPNGLLGFLPEADPSRSLVGKFVEAVGTYSGLSINAFNLWRNPWSGLGDTPFRGDDLTGFMLGSGLVTWQQVGSILFALAAIGALWQVARRDDMRGVLLATLVLAVAFFAVPTRVHERYLFPALVLAAPLLFRSRQWAIAYGALGLLTFANIYWAYTQDWSWANQGVINPGLGGLPMPQDGILDATLLTDYGIYLLSAAIVVLLGLLVWRSGRLALHPRAEPVIAAVAADAGPVPVERHPPPAAAEPLAPRESAGGGDRWRWLRPDPADPYLREQPRRLDRVDLALVIGLVAFALVFRLWRLDVPRGMHFDEVYHARSATEWMANWQNGWRRDVYEWTHPMLAKYLIAGGIAFADPNKVVRETELAAEMTAMAVAPARSSESRERSVVFTAADSEITARDAETGEEIARWEADGQVAALAFDDRDLRLLVGGAATGSIEVYDLAAFLAADGARAPPPRAADLATATDGAAQILVPAESETVYVRGPAAVTAIDRTTGSVSATVQLAAGGIGWLPAVEEMPARLVASLPDRGVIGFFDAVTLAPILQGASGVEAPAEVAVTARLIGPLLTRGSGDDQHAFALTGPLPATSEYPATAGGVAVVDGDRQSLITTTPLPGSASFITLQPVANLIYLGGVTDDGAGAVWTMQPHGETRGDSAVGYAVFDATPLPGEPLAMGLDTTRFSQADDHATLLVSTAADDAGDGASLVTLDAGSNAFAWRLSGVVFGSLLVGLVYLLAATLFARRRIAVLAGAFVALDGMSFVMSRISMNDIFVATFIAAAYLLFWQVWSGRWRRSAWWAMPVVGVLIGLAAATKWVGFYALAGLVVLVLARSTLGRLMLTALLAVVAVVGGIDSPWPFLLLVIAALALTMLVVYHRPIGFHGTELRVALPAIGLVLGGIGLAFAIAHGQVASREPTSGVEVLFSYLARGAQAGWPGWLLLGVSGALIAWRAAVSLRDPGSDARWWQPDALGGFSLPWVGACLIVVPLAVYLLTFAPYLDLGHAIAAAEGTGPGYHWSLDELHAQMFGYHFRLQAGHDSASPWWSWPLALKPTWFFSQDYDMRQLAVIYNGGNPILVWAGVPAMVVCGILTWKRRSLALALVVAAFAFQFLPWMRIERATFAYHYLTAVVFAMIAVAYLVDEGLRRTDWRDLAIGFLALAVVAGLLVFPLGAALPMPDWYITAARALPPWNFAFQFPDPPAGIRAELISVSAPKLLAGIAVAVIVTAFAVGGRSWLDRFRGSGRVEPAEG